MVEKQTILDAFYFRHACKVFDQNKKIPSQDMEFLFECARLSPTSFGMEHHRMLHVQDESIRQKLKPACWDQNQITTCSDLVVFKAITEDVKPDSAYVRQMFERKNLGEEATRAYLKRYEHFLSDKDVECWATKQCYITLANMMTAAAMREIDSCAIEGFETKEVEDILNIDTSRERVAMIGAFGYRVDEQPKKYRLNKDELITKM